MSVQAERKITQYLHEAHALELQIVQTLLGHIAVTPDGVYRNGLERHVEQTREHARRIQKHLTRREAERGAMSVGYGVAQSVMAQVFSMGKLPLDLIRGMSPEEKLLKNAKDECATEALEIATYTAIEQLARQVGDTATENLASSIKREEEAQLDRLLEQIPRLTADVVSAEVDGRSQFDTARIGAADAARFVATTAARSVARTASRAANRAEPTGTGTVRQGRRPVRKAPAQTTARTAGGRTAGKATRGRAATSAAAKARTSSKATKARTSTKRPRAAARTAAKKS